MILLIEQHTNIFKEIKLDKTPDDPLKFNDKKKYKDRLREYRKKTNCNDAFILGIDDSGNVLHNLQYGASDAYSPITSAKQYDGYLYFGSLTHEGWGKIEAPK